MGKILNIELPNNVYNMVVDEADNNDRSVRKMVAMLVERGLGVRGRYTTEDIQPNNELVDRMANQFISKKQAYENDPEYIELKSEVDELSEELDEVEDMVRAREIMESIQGIKLRMSEIINKSQ